MAYAEKRGRGEYPWRVKYKKPDGTEASASGFRTRTEALKHGRQQEADVQRGTWRDPKRGEILLADYFENVWLPAQDVGANTRSKRRSQYRAHIGPEFGATAIGEINPFAVKRFEKELRTKVGKSWADKTMELLRLMMADAVFAEYIGSSPVQPKQRRGKRAPDTTRPGMAVDVATIEAIRSRLAEPESLMVLLIAFTGMRWGEAIGVRRTFLTLQDASGGRPASGRYVIDPDIGAVHEDERGRRHFGPPKGGKGRTVELPPFLVPMLRAYLKFMPAGRDLLFVNRNNTPHSRSHFNRNLWRPACDGWPARETVRGHPAIAAVGPAAAGMVVHDLRHTHKTWLAEDGIEPVARDERLGHATPGMDGIYIHATAAMRARILEVLEQRWNSRPESGSPKTAPKKGGDGMSEPLFTLAS